MIRLHFCYKCVRYTRLRHRLLQTNQVLTVVFFPCLRCSQPSGVSDECPVSVKPVYGKQPRASHTAAALPSSGVSECHGQSSRRCGTRRRSSTASSHGYSTLPWLAPLRGVSSSLLSPCLFASAVHSPRATSSNRTSFWQHDVIISSKP